MTLSFPKTVEAFQNLSWSQIEPYYHDLATRPINPSSIEGWLSDWSRLRELLYETHQRLYVSTTRNTADPQAEKRFSSFLDDIFPPAQAADQKLKTRLLGCGLEPPGFEMPLKNMRAEADLFRDANLPLLAEELKLSMEYDRIIGAQTVKWEGREVTLQQLLPVYQDPDRSKREQAWRLATERQLADRKGINDLWARFMDLRYKLAVNAGRADYRAYRWQQLLRFDYTPADCYNFHRAIEEVVVPAASRVYEKRRKRLGLERLRPWDLNVDPLDRPPLQPYRTLAELEDKTEAIFRGLDPQLGEYFAIMRREGLLDLDNRKGKAPGGYCTEYPATRRPFIFMNAVGLHVDVQTLFHEGGHAFHTFERSRLPYHQQRHVGEEFGEVASMAMEHLGGDYLPARLGGFYSDGEAARARIQHLESDLTFWPYMAVVDAFQHWAYEKHARATDPTNCDAKWAELYQRFMVGVDWGGLEDAMRTGWQRRLHIHENPFYYVEYGMASLGAVQIWHNATKNRAQAVADYRKALSLGGTVPLPELYRAAGAKFSFDARTINQAVDLIEETIETLEAV
jgi:oligoendopeptidase F